MKITSLASVLAVIMGITNAYAGDTVAKDGSTDHVQTQDKGIVADVKSGLRKADHAIRNKAEDIKAFFVGDETGGDMDPIVISKSTTAHGMIGQPVLNPQGREIAELKDIILDKDGDAILAVVSDGGVLGIGNKLAAFDYGRVVAQHKDGKVVMALSQDMIDKAADFSYDRDDREKAKVIPADSYSVNDILDGELLDSRGKDAGAIENISFENGHADRVIVGFDKVMGMGGKLAALNYSTLKKVRATGEVNLQMNDGQSDQFANFGSKTKTSNR